MKIVGLVGFAGSGKDYLCKGLGWPRAAFADPLKRDLAGFLGVALEELESRKDEFRPMMVAYGATKRLLNPAHWIGELDMNLKLRGYDKVCITDTRYLNEAQWIVDRGGLLIHVKRPGVYAANAEEEKSIEQIAKSALPRMTVWNVNDEGIEELKWIVASKFKVAA